MESIASIIQNTVSITQFNRGMAGQIFEDVKKSGTKVVLKNNAVECILVSPERYLALIEELMEAQLLATANARLARFQGKTGISSDELWKQLSVTQEEVDAADEVEFE